MTASTHEESVVRATNGERTSSLRDDLSRPSAYGGGSVLVTAEETPASWVFLVGGEVYKVKKPVDLGFLDFRTLAAREEACHEEVALNRRLAPDVYLGIVPVCEDHVGRASIVGTGRVVDCAVHMRRLPARRRADHLLAEGGLTAQMIDHIAARLAIFHARARCDRRTSEFGSAAHLLETIEGNLTQIDRTHDDYLTAEQADEILRWETAFVHGHARDLAARVAEGRIRDGHGDLRLKHMYMLGDEPTILDCVEFNEIFRYGDVASDLAFLTMDLAQSGRVDLAERLLARYARDTGDYGLYTVVDFYESYRAVVGGTLSAWLAESTTDAGVTVRASKEARRSLLFALSLPRSSLLLPAVVVVGGGLASGKSTIAGALADLMNAPCIGGDRTSKEMLGRYLQNGVDSVAWEATYDPAIVDGVYAELLRRAELVIASGRPVVLDASFRSRAMRREVRELADRRSVPFRFVECRADEDLCRARLLEGAPPSDGGAYQRAVLVDAFQASFQAVDELPEGEHIVLDTAVPLAASLDTLRARLATWPARFVG